MTTQPGRLSDAELLAAIATSDGGAFTEFYRRHLPTVLAYLVRETRDRETAADLAAEVFAAVLLAANRYQERSASAAPWVIGIARNKLLESLRRGRVEARARRRLGFDPVALEDADLERVEVMADTGASRLSQLLERLPPEEREALRSRVVDERSYHDIAIELQCSEMVIRKRVSRGLARVRDQLNEADRRERLSEQG
jgi:RNA polymerase sigma factor (sigma-70 family)